MSKDYLFITPEPLPPGLQLMMDNFNWAKESMNGILGINADRLGRTSSGMAEMYANATRDYEAYKRIMNVFTERRKLRASRRFHRISRKSNIRLMLSIIKR